MAVVTNMSYGGKPLNKITRHVPVHMKIQEIGQKKWVSSLKSHKLRWAMDKKQEMNWEKEFGSPEYFGAAADPHWDWFGAFGVWDRLEYALSPKFCVSQQNGDNKIGDFWEMMNDLMYWDRSSSKCIIAYSKSE